MSVQTTTTYTCDGCSKTTADNAYWYHVACQSSYTLAARTLVPNDFCSARCLALHYAKAAHLMLVDAPRRAEVAERVAV